MKLFNYTYVLFGPIMMICCFYGVIFIKGLMFECEPNKITGTVNFMDIFILMGCCVFSTMITLFFSMHQSVELVNKHLRNENSVMYRIFFKYLTYKRRQSNRES